MGRWIRSRKVWQSWPRHNSVLTGIPVVPLSFWEGREEHLSLVHRGAQRPAQGKNTDQTDVNEPRSSRHVSALPGWGDEA